VSHSNGQVAFKYHMVCLFLNSLHPPKHTIVSLRFNATLDDAVIHLDCGAVLDNSTGNGFLAFVGYARHIISSGITDDWYFDLTTTVGSIRWW
jgi:hypothetical protein